jgi:hypothetical protein
MWEGQQSYIGFEIIASFAYLPPHYGWCQNVWPRVSFQFNLEWFSGSYEKIRDGQIAPELHGDLFEKRNKK